MGASTSVARRQRASSSSPPEEGPRGGGGAPPSGGGGGGGGGERAAPAPREDEARGVGGEEDWSWTRVELKRWRVSGVDVVGLGAHCVVRRGVDVEDPMRVVAVKEYVGGDAWDRLHREVAMLSTLARADATAWLAPLAWSDDGDPAVVAALELGERSLADAIILDKDDEARRIVHGRADEVLRDAGRALSAMHAVGIVHGDVKPANVVRCGGRWRLIDVDDAMPTGAAVDFAAARDDDDDDDDCFFFFTEIYAAPELARAAATEASGYTVAPTIDAWGLGMAVAEVVLRDHPLQAAMEHHGDGFLTHVAALDDAVVAAWLDPVLPTAAASVLAGLLRCAPGDRLAVATAAADADTHLRDSPKEEEEPPADDDAPPPPGRATPKKPKTPLSLYREDHLPRLVDAMGDEKQALRAIAMNFSKLKKTDPALLNSYVARAAEEAAAAAAGSTADQP